MVIYACGFLCLPVCAEGTATRGGCLSDPERLGSGAGGAPQTGMGASKGLSFSPEQRACIANQNCLRYVLHPTSTQGMRQSASTCGDSAKVRLKSPDDHVMLSIRRTGQCRASRMEPRCTQARQCNSQTNVMREIITLGAKSEFQNSLPWESTA